jgi:16S rRNA (guanine(966)-N(2))-methyltransferase RsmD
VSTAERDERSRLPFGRFIVRVTGGSLGGRRLRVPPTGVRPSADRMRESLFAALGEFDDARVLDLYAGSGSLGIEALSRGAASATFVDASPSSVVVLKKNLVELGVLDRASVIRDDALRAVRRLARMGECFDLVLADPPYTSDEADRLLLEPSLRDLLAGGGTLVLEFERRHSLPAPEGLIAIDERRYGDTAVARFAIAGDGEAARGAASE